ncbi:hypothetical protein B0H63DRAFT_506902 [Podospora didyma]|uniref:Uncharacterized protein n=1 Tax=Podospora didyma TaxID=330526 RepID=A0AAE0U3A5_9PEZI|nr:hypothetical protein B0H63DRAFT_506902 [Podospora didyma]
MPDTVHTPTRSQSAEEMSDTAVYTPTHGRSEEKSASYADERESPVSPRDDESANHADDPKSPISPRDKEADDASVGDVAAFLDDLEYREVMLSACSASMWAQITDPRRGKPWGTMWIARFRRTDPRDLEPLFDSLEYSSDDDDAWKWRHLALFCSSWREERIGAECSSEWARVIERTATEFEVTGSHNEDATHVQLLVTAAMLLGYEELFSLAVEKCAQAVSARILRILSMNSSSKLEDNYLEPGIFGMIIKRRRALIQEILDKFHSLLKERYLAEINRVVSCPSNCNNLIRQSIANNMRMQAAGMSEGLPPTHAELVDDSPRDLLESIQAAFYASFRTDRTHEVCGMPNRYRKPCPTRIKAHKEWSAFEDHVFDGGETIEFEEDMKDFMWEQRRELGLERSPYDDLRRSVGHSDYEADPDRTASE